MTQPILTPAIIVAGSAPVLFRDLAECPPGLPLMGVNYAGLMLKGVAHIASYHAKAAGLIAQLRACAQHSLKDTAPPEVHSTSAAPGVTRVWPEPDGGGGSSGLFAVRVALALGYGRVILAGMPLDDSGRFYDPPQIRKLDFASHYLDAWVKALPDFQGRVVSCSGMTKTLLGGL